MFINEVENIVKLSKKAIRYYEEEGLINPERNQNNDYRLYTEEDLNKLKTIKFLRELGVPISELKKLNNHELSLQECLKERITKIENEEENYLKVKNMCAEIIESNDTYENINITKYFQNINILNKEGFTMYEIKSNKKKKIIGAVLSSLIFGLLFLIPCIVIFIIGTIEIIKYGLDIYCLAYYIPVLILIIPTIAIIINLIKRIKEINGGEEDEASKY